MPRGRHVRLAPRGRTVRQVRRGPIVGLEASIGASSGVSKGFGGLVTLPPPQPEGLYIPAYLGAPDVGTLDDKNTLPTWGASQTFTTPGQVIEGYKFNGTVSVQADPVTFRNCWFNGGWGTWGIQVNSGSGRAIVEDSEFQYYNGAALFPWQGPIEAYRCNINNCKDGAKITTGCHYEMLHVHTHNTTESSPHYDGIQAEGTVASAGATVQFCHFSGKNHAGGNISGCFQIQPEKNASAPGVENLVVHNNLLRGSGIQLRLYNKYHDPPGYWRYTIDSVVTDNIFDTDYTYNHYSAHSGTVATWSGNEDINGNPINY